MKITKSIIAVVALPLTLYLAGCASEDGPPAISANKQPLNFQVISASITKESQLSEQVQMDLSGFDVAAAASQSGYSYHGPIKEVRSYEPIPLDSSESFLIVKFRVSNVRRKLQLSTTDVELIDGKSSAHQTLGLPGHKEGSWYQLSSEELDPAKDNGDTWIFKVPTDAVSGSVIQFQNATYPLSVVN